MLNVSKPVEINLSLPRSWNECSIEQLEIISRVMLEQIERTSRYHPFDMRNVKIACFFLLADVDIVEYPDSSLPVEAQCYMCRMASDRPHRFRLNRRRCDEHEKVFPLFLWQINYWLSPKAKTDDRTSAEYMAAGAGILDWMDSDKRCFLTRFPYPALRLRNPNQCLRKRVEFEGPAPDMDGFSWQQFRFAADLMAQYIQLSNNLDKMKKMMSFKPEQMAAQADNVKRARDMFLATIFNRRIPYIDSNTSLRTVDFHYDVRQFNDNADFFANFPDYRWQLVLFWWTGMMHTLSRRFPHVFKVQNLANKKPSSPLEIYTATIATMQKYASLTEDQVNNQSYALVLEHLERMSKENEEMEKIRKG